MPTRNPRLSGEIFANAEIILDIGLKQFVPDVVLRLSTVLRVACDVSHEQVSKRVASRIGSSAVEPKIPLKIHVGHLVLLSRRKISAELQVMLA